MHRQLLALLKNGYLKKESDITDWREQFKEYSDNPDIVDGDIRGHFDHLEKIGEIDIGNYNVLRRIFKTFNAKAVKLIDKFLDKIQTAPCDCYLEWYINLFCFLMYYNFDEDIVK